MGAEDKDQLLSVYENVMARENSSLKERISRWMSLDSILFCSGVLLLVGFGIIVCSKPAILTSELQILVLDLGLIFFVISFLALSTLTSGQHSILYLKNLLFSSVWILPIFMMTSRSTIGSREAAFSVAFLFWLALTLIFVQEKFTGWEKVLAIMGTVWTFSMAIISAGSGFPFSYSVEIIDSLTGLHALLDLRWFSMAVFAVSLAATGVVQSFRQGEIVVADLPKVVIPGGAHENAENSETTFLESMIAPIITLLNALLDVLHAIVEALWKATLTVALFFVRVGKNSGKIAWNLVADNGVLRTVMCGIGSFFIILITSELVTQISFVLPIYIVENGWFDGMKLALEILLLGWGVFLLVVAFNRLSSGLMGEEFKSNAPGALSTHLMGVFISSLLILSLNRFGVIHADGFRVPGPFTTFFGLFVAVGVGYSVVRGIREKAGLARKVA